MIAHPFFSPYICLIEDIDYLSETYFPIKNDNSLTIGIPLIQEREIMLVKTNH